MWRAEGTKQPHCNSDSAAEGLTQFLPSRGHFREHIHSSDLALPHCCTPVPLPDAACSSAFTSSEQRSCSPWEHLTRESSRADSALHAIAGTTQQAARGFSDSHAPPCSSPGSSFPWPAQQSQRQSVPFLCSLCSAVLPALLLGAHPQLPPPFSIGGVLQPSEHLRGLFWTCLNTSTSFCAEGPRPGCSTPDGGSRGQQRGTIPLCPLPFQGAAFFLYTQQGDRISVVSLCHGSAQCGGREWGGGGQAEGHQGKEMGGWIGELGQEEQ